MRRIIAIAFLVVIALLLTQAEWWLVLAVGASAIVGITILTDAYLFNGGVYKNAIEPTVISGLLQLTPCFIIPLWMGERIAAVQMDVVTVVIALVAIIAGIANVGAWGFYFKAMRIHQDGVGIAVLWNLLIATVPVVAYFTIGEELRMEQYIGIGMLFLGATIASYRKKTEAGGKVVLFMLLAVALMTVSVIMLKDVFAMFEARRESEVFWKGFLPFALGEGLVGMAVFFIMTRRETIQLGGIVKRFWPIFLLTEGGQVVAEIFSARALSEGAASLVTAVDGLIGAFVVTVSILVAWMLKGTRRGLLAEEVEQKQIGSIGQKLVGIVLVTIGAYLIGT